MVTQRVNLIHGVHTDDVLTHCPLWDGFRMDGSMDSTLINSLRGAFLMDGSLMEGCLMDGPLMDVLAMNGSVYDIPLMDSTLENDLPMDGSVKDGSRSYEWCYGWVSYGWSGGSLDDDL
ncbi:hypothetical protein SK128_007620, partial [Halocaridina rubra]